MDEDRVTYFAETDARNRRMPFGIKASDRSRHMYVIGKTGMGKSTLLENMAVQDIKNGEGMAFIDPHGKTADLLLDYIPHERMKDVLYFAPFDMDHPISFNVMEDVGADKRHLVANGLMSAFKKIWVDAWSARMEYILNNILLALLEYPDSTLIGVNRMLADKEYRKLVVANISDPSVKSFWIDEFAKYGDRYMQEAGAAIQNKIGQFVSNPLVRNIIGQAKSTFDIRKMMDEKKIIIINLSKGRVGEANANLLGSMLITKIYLGAMSRADVSPGHLKKLPNFYLYVDEFQSFANESFADILSEARKYKLALLIAHQYVEQMSEEVRAAVFGNVGSMIVFRVGAFDAELLEKEFFPTFTKEDLVNLGFVQIYLKLMINGVSSQPFSAVTLPPIEKPLVSFKEDIIKYSREVYARPRLFVEEAIKKWHEPIRLEERKPVRLESKIEHKPENRPSASHEVSHNVNPSKPSQPQTLPHPHEEKNQNNPKIEKKEVGHEDHKHTRELELRKAISQNYANSTPQRRPEENRPPKKDKSPTPENMSALRQALAAVMKDTSPAPKPEPSYEKPHAEARPAEPNPAPKPEEKKPNHAHIPPKEPEVKEVPEEVLKRILDTDK